MQSLMKVFKTKETSQSSDNRGSLVLLRRGWSVRKLWILSIIGVAGIGLDAIFHTLDSGTPLTIIFDGVDFSTGQWVLTSSPEIATLSWVGHITFLQHLQCWLSYQSFSSQIPRHRRLQIVVT